MELKDLASVSGKGGLYKVLKPGKAGVLLESLDDAKTRLVAGGSNRISLLEEISMYTRTKDGSQPLGEILKKIYSDFGADPGVDANSDADELKSFMKAILPEYDEDRVYVSDIKKLVKWYGIIHSFAPEILQEEKKDSEKVEESQPPQ
ncbi:MAG TPA: DUF5606 domain-containing protein [Cyclobacteriaceae bacterium]|nr:DUF5606 domain-containing protein [Cyclobacteriaceae bacterium]